MARLPVCTRRALLHPAIRWILLSCVLLLSNTQALWAQLSGEVSVEPARIVGASFPDTTVTLRFPTPEDAQRATTVTFIGAMNNGGVHTFTKTLAVADSLTRTLTLSRADIHAVVDSETVSVFGRYRLVLMPAAGETPFSSDCALYIVETGVQEGWSAPLVLNGDGGRSTVVLAAAVNGRDDVDIGEDLLEPPPPPERFDMPRLTLLHASGWTLSREVRHYDPATSANGILWTLRAFVPSVGGPYRLDWSALLTTLSGYFDNFFLQDGERQLDMTAFPTGMTLPPGTYTFTLIVQKSETQPLLCSIPEGWSLFSVPGTGDLAPKALFGTENTVSTLYGWDAEGQRYRFVSPTSSNPLEAVTSGYFLHRTTSGDALTLHLNVDAPGVRVVDVPLRPGWNLVGSVADGAFASGLAGDNAVFEWNPVAQEYRPAPLLLPFKAYWVYTETARSARLTQLRHVGTIAAHPLIGEASAPSRAESSRRSDWMVALKLCLNDGSVRVVELGASPNAQAEYDPLDIPQPPPPMLRACPEFYAVEHGLARRLTRSVLPVAQNGAEWTLVVHAPNGGTLRWDVSALPRGYRLYLENASAKDDLNRDDAITLNAGEHVLRVRVLREAPAVSRLLANYPNPFNPETWIPFELTESADVRIGIFNRRGERLRTLDLGHREAGSYTSHSEAAH